MLTKLDAVNRCLRAIGEARINSLDSGVPDAADAEALIDETVTEVLGSGWHFNTEQGVEFEPSSSSSRVVLSKSILSIKGSGRDYYRNFTMRRSGTSTPPHLYDLDEKTDKFERPVTLSLVRDYSFENIPHPHASYVTARAARIFQENAMGSQALDGFTARQEAEAWARLMDSEAEASGLNALHDSPTMALMTHRNQPIGWR